MRHVFLGLALAAIGGLTTILATGADVPDTDSGKVLVAKVFRASKLSGLNIRNMSGEKLGTVNDMVVDVEKGTISYVALSVGGIAGIGNKLFAVPYQQMKFTHGKDEMFFALDVTKEKLENAPGFDKDNWPDFANSQWWSDVDKYYGPTRSTTTRTTVTPDKK